MVVDSQQGRRGAGCGAAACEAPVLLNVLLIFDPQSGELVAQEEEGIDFPGFTVERTALALQALQEADGDRNFTADIAPLDAVGHPARETPGSDIFVRPVIAVQKRGDEKQTSNDFNR
ncbi:MAG TPA: hypothetical protein VFL57_02815 [Bryobacteraceae bacterium]|nr:hypothetical protein [Bryobacteraceae bacterium]